MHTKKYIVCVFIDPFVCFVLQKRLGVYSISVTKDKSTQGCTIVQVYKVIIYSFFTGSHNSFIRE